jgi:glyceraldehyde-3-phosphate dehydrogenase [NAD(P)+]
MIPTFHLSGFFDEILERYDGEARFRMFVEGRWVESFDKTYFELHTPIDGSLLGYIPKAGVEDVEKAVGVARREQRKIRDLAAIERIEIFRQAAQVLEERMGDFVTALVHEAGKPRRDAEGEVSATALRLKLTMEEVKKISGEYIPGDWSDDTRGKIAVVIREPVGVVAAISPFNYPLFIQAAKVIPALLAGNSVVLKPASSTPLSALMFARVLQESGIPSGCLNVITGPGSIGMKLVEHPHVSLVSFTGSTKAGREISRAVEVKRLHLELGGKAVAIVLSDADIELAARKCVEGAFRNAGQRCDAVSLVLVEEAVAQHFVEKVLDEASKWVVGDPRKENVKLGPLINNVQVQRVHRLVVDAVEKGAKLLMGGRFEGNYYQPTVLDYVPRGAEIMWEEIFGPVLPIARVRDVGEALEIASAQRYGLDSCVFTNNFYRMWSVAKRLQVGSVTVNDMPRHGVGYFPFGGVKESGIGREGIGYSIDEMTVLKTIVFNLEPIGYVKKKRTELM